MTYTDDTIYFSATNILYSNFITLTKAVLKPTLMSVSKLLSLSVFEFHVYPNIVMILVGV